MSETEIIPIDVQETAKQSEVLSGTYTDFQITTAGGYADAGNDLKKIKAKAKELDILRKTLTRPLDESKRKIMDFFQKPLTFLKTAEAAVNTAMVAWHKAQEQIRLVEEQRVREAQRKETERLDRLAAAAKERGDTKKAEAFEDRAAITESATPIVAARVSKVAGLAMTTTWKYRIVDVGKIPLEYMMPNEVLLGQVVRSTKGNLKIEGIEIYPDESMRGTRS